MYNILLLAKALLQKVANPPAWIDMLQLKWEQTELHLALQKYAVIDQLTPP